MPEPKLAEYAEDIAANLNLSIAEFAGGGAFKETYRAVSSSDETVALKIFDPSNCDLARAEREFDAMRSCDSPRVAKLFDWGIDKSHEGKSFVYVVEEFLTGGTLEEKLKSGVLITADVRNIGLAIAEALLVLESHTLVHRDIKPANIMFRAGDSAPVLVDFGLVRDTSRSSLTPTFLPSGPGTPLFASPEQLNNDKLLIDWRTDQFCLGLVLGVCQSGQHPYWKEGLNEGQVVSLVAERESASDRFREALSGDLKAIVRMIEPWPVKRFPTPEILIGALSETED